jgi:hypothetical protein
MLRATEKNILPYFYNIQNIKKLFKDSEKFDLFGFS